MKKLLYFIAVLFSVIAMSACNQHDTENTAETIYINKGQKVVSASFGYGGHIAILTETADSGCTPNVKTLVDYSTNIDGGVGNVIAVFKLVEQ